MIILIYELKFPKFTNFPEVTLFINARRLTFILNLAPVFVYRYKDNDSIKLKIDSYLRAIYLVRLIKPLNLLTAEAKKSKTKKLR